MQKIINKLLRIKKIFFGLWGTLLELKYSLFGNRCGWAGFALRTIQLLQKENDLTDLDLTDTLHLMQYNLGTYVIFMAVHYEDYAT